MGTMGRHNGIPEDAPSELDRRVYHLKTLYDVSREVFSSIDFETILRSFLLMTMGNFGVIRGAISTYGGGTAGVNHFVVMGFDHEEREALKGCSLDMFKAEGGPLDSRVRLRPSGFPESVSAILPFELAPDSSGLMMLGDKLTEEAFTEDDQELLVTLVNNLVVALKNARSFERISRLNEDLRDKNEQLEKTLQELRAALRKVEILESIKANLCKFVPTTVTRMIEDAPTTVCLDAKERDVSVMFLDIEGYTRITEQRGAAHVNELVERYFSVFMDAIYSNNGDVLETSGDGLLVAFLSQDENANATGAVSAALMIREQTARVNQECQGQYQPLAINIGVTSGPAIVGANKFESYTGARWVYATHGMTVNLAARICSHARGGAVLACRETASRVGDRFAFVSTGKYALKNVTEPVEIFAIQ
jgi:class 3 adenylate cyclase